MRGKTRTSVHAIKRLLAGAAVGVTLAFGPLGIASWAAVAVAPPPTAGEQSSVLPATPYGVGDTFCRYFSWAC